MAKWHIVADFTVKNTIDGNRYFEINTITGINSKDSSINLKPLVLNHRGFKIVVKPNYLDTDILIWYYTGKKNPAKLAQNHFPLKRVKKWLCATGLINHPVVGGWMKAT